MQELKAEVKREMKEEKNQKKEISISISRVLSWQSQCPIIYLSVLPSNVFRRIRASSPIMTMVYTNLQPPENTA